MGRGSFAAGCVSTIRSSTEGSRIRRARAWGLETASLEVELPELELVEVELPELELVEPELVEPELVELELVEVELPEVGPLGPGLGRVRAGKAPAEDRMALGSPTWSRSSAGSSFARGFHGSSRARSPGALGVPGGSERSSSDIEPKIHRLGRFARRVP